MLKILQDETDAFDTSTRLRDDVLDAMERVQKEAINYTRCCETLKDKKPISFQDYKRLNYAHLTNVYACKYTKQILSYEETLEEYNKYLDSF